ncbi:aminotransferase class V-fold PLP-dependent enzyme [Corynebacterium testudinoris]|uniref:Selenocysteine lyase n=2 Tax=Corynebacterium testudinoris TaxID=136857 RepID=A0A0G3H912_9CORY|nr:selenocysteine lyase [Corynebacterium testudinoris]MBX8996085.1 aminotransferase class V-fold PLP-dependent enzyme [Corynebacterium testudinoris]
MVYDVASVRGLYTSLGDGWTYLNAHDCPQIPERVSASVARSFRQSSRVAADDGTVRVVGDMLLDVARTAVAEFCDAEASQVVLGPNLQALYGQLARAMQPMFRYSSSIVLSRLDAPERNAVFETLTEDVRWAQPDLGTGSLPSWQFRELVDGSTRLVTLSAAQSYLGTVAPVADIVDTVRSRSRAWVVVDASAFAPYRSVDLEGWGADIVALDVAEMGGPQMAALVFRDPAMFRRIDPLVEQDLVPGLAGGVPAVIDHLAGLVEGFGHRHRQVADSLQQMHFYLQGLMDDLITMIGTHHSVHLVGISGEAGDGGLGERIPRLSFAVRGVPATTVCQRLSDNGIITTVLPDMEVFDEMGVDEVGGAVTVSLGPFNTRHDIEHLTRVVASLA